MSLIRDDDGDPQFQVAIIEDVTDGTGCRAGCAYQATHDPLTGLPNRTLFFDRLDERWPTPTPGARVGLCLLDLDGFKVDQRHARAPVGDRLLTAVADRLDAGAVAARATWWPGSAATSSSC